MNDCANADVRDLLPELLHGRLDEATRAGVEAHLAVCADCRAELELLRAAGRALSYPPVAVDVQRIVAALPAPGRARPRRWPRAAAFAALAAGLMTVAVWRRGDERAGTTPGQHVDTGPVVAARPSDSVARPAAGGLVAPGGASDSARTRRGPDRAPTPREDATLLAMGELSDLSADQLESVLAGLDDLDGIPSVEPQALPSPLTSRERLQ